MIPIINGKESVLQWIQDKNQSLQANEQQAVLEARVRDILLTVKTEGDQGLHKIAKSLGDETLPNGFLLTEDAKNDACKRLPEGSWQVLRYAAKHIREFSDVIAKQAQPVTLQHHGFSVGIDWKPVERVACYVPAGRFPLPSTALMTALTAQAAGVKDICVVSPKLTDEVIAAGTLAGVSEFYQIGGAQAVAAMSYGTETIIAASMVVGPGNAYVTEAKRQLQGVVGIDMLAGPSEVVIIADNGANAEWVAWDLLAQAEHSPDACAYLLTDSPQLADAVRNALAIACKTPGLPDYLCNTTSWGAICVLDSLNDCVDICNQLAPEHVELQTSEPLSIKPKLQDYGALFMGYHTPVPFGDYAAGPNHTLPTNRSARFSGTLTPMTFLRPQSWIHATEEATPLAKICQQFAEIEGLNAHANASRLRANIPAAV